ncbi:hypothetical protein [Niveibacterium sp. COAC-50]|uniref:hypothetical protein n=1 Tax=Niveibacterium sp. COAC-50 TaxID=2729384 RepID=UPI001555A58A|nr:hypothetical protein [Niveibacterium sp. COAC-50]
MFCHVGTCRILAIAALLALAACGGGEGASTPVVLPPAITSQPQAMGDGTGSTVQFRVEASGGELAYQWQKASGKNAAFVDIQGATAATLSVVASGDADGTLYRAVVTNPAGRTISDAATLTVFFSARALSVGAPAVSWRIPGTTELVSLSSSDIGTTDWIDRLPDFGPVDTVLAADGRALVRWSAMTGSEYPRDPFPHREVFVSRGPSGSWFPAEQLDVTMWMPRLVANESGWVSMFKQDMRLTSYWRSTVTAKAQQIGPGVGAQLLASSELEIPDENSGAWIASDGTQFVRWAPAAIRDRDTYLQVISPEGIASPAQSILSSSGNVDAPAFSESAWEDRADALPIVWKDVADNSINVKFLAPYLNSISDTGKMARLPSNAVSCGKNRVFHNGALTVAIWAEYDGKSAIEFCPLHVSVLDQRNHRQLSYDQVVNDATSTVTGPVWVSIDSVGNLEVLWVSERWQRVLMHSHTSVPDPERATSGSNALVWSVPQTLKDDNGETISPLRLDRRDPVIRTGPAGHIAIAFPKPHDRLALKIYTPGQGWSADKHFATGYVDMLGSGNLALDRSGKVLATYFAATVLNSFTGAVDHKRRTLMAAVIE